MLKQGSEKRGREKEIRIERKEERKKMEMMSSECVVWG